MIILIQFPSIEYQNERVVNIERNESSVRVIS